MTRDVAREIESVAALEEPVRRRLYFFVAGSAQEVSRDRAARAVGISRALAAFHLDRLAEDGMLEVTYRRLGKKKGPGAGRPSKLYRRSSREVQLSIPHREYELAARLMARALEKDTPRTDLNSVAREYGESLGKEAAGRGSDSRALFPPLRECGYEPYRTADGCIRLRNCPFHALASEHREMVCHMNHALLNGLVNGLGASGVEARLEPAPGECCVALHNRREGRGEKGEE